MGTVTYKQLFNLKKDPFERNNLIDDVKFQSKISGLEKELKRLIKESNDPADLNASDFGLYSEFNI
ncbi:MAG: hypothetical protein COB60_05730 [Flavobacteriaceae bacterium]|nr:MAG: hypothetical protein COB60_05730 [Flavobacteriaceae bacterium]